MSRAGAAERLARLLAIVPWVASHDGPTVAEVCERFGVSERDLLADLDLLFLCGVHPFTPDSLIEVDVADGRVWIRFADWFRRPLRLTGPEGLALLCAGSAALAIPGADPDGALAGALAKLRALLGLPSEEAVDVELASVPPTVLDGVRRAVSEGRRLELEYYSFGADRVGTRVVQPWRVFNADSEWYLSAWCEQAAGERLFRLDRVRAFRVLDDAIDHPAPAGPAPEVFTPGPGTRRVVLDLSPAARWVAERYPNEGLEERGDGTWRVVLVAGERAWLERLLLRAGSAARVVSGAEGVAAAAAERVLQRYRAG